MDPNILQSLLAQRAMQQQAPPAQGQPPQPPNMAPQGGLPQAAPTPAPPVPTPAVPPSGGHTNTPPQLQRFLTAQQMMDGYRNGWTPNPILLRAANGHR